MPHYDHIHIIGNHLYGVLQCLSLALTRVACVGESYHLGTQTVDGCLEAESRSCRRLEEETGYNLALKEVLHLVLFELPCSLQHVEYFLLAEVTD